MEPRPVMDAAAWISVASVCAAGAMSPGPSLAVVVKNTVQGGRKQGVMTAIGHGLGVGFYAFVAVFGMARVLDAFPGMARGIEIGGGLYLLWLGIQAFRFAGKGDMTQQQTDRRGFFDGMAISVLNPKIAVFFLALLVPFLPLDATAADRAGVAGLAMVIDGGWYMFAAILLATTGAADWLASKGIWVDRVLGTILFAVAGWLLLS
jgi:threonine/homoserine/homoserine lactone efflux protein